MSALENTDDVTLFEIEGYLSAEPSVAIHPEDPNTVLAACMLLQEQFSEDPEYHDIGAFMSNDGGATWSGTMSVSPIENLAQDDDYADPVASWVKDESGQWAALVSYIGYSVSGHDNDVFVAASTDTGTSWSIHTVFDGGTSWDTDKSWIMGTEDGSEVVHCAFWRRASGSDLNKVVYTRSSDLGSSWSTPEQLAPDLSMGLHEPNIALGLNDDVFIALSAFDSEVSATGGEDAIVVLRSTDAGESWSSPTTPSVDGIRGNFSSWGTGPEPWWIRKGVTPGLAVDRSQSPQRGNVYVAWTNVDDVDDVDDSNVYVVRSTDGGSTFGSWVKVHATDPDAQWCAALACDPATGAVAAIWYDQTLNTPIVASDDLTWTKLGFSWDGGASWEEHTLSDEQFHPEPYGGIVGFMGEYISVAASGGLVVPVWVDGRTGVSNVRVSPVVLDWAGTVTLARDVVVPSGHKLTVTAGTHVDVENVASIGGGKSDTEVEIIVEGTLEAAGTESEPIEFSAPVGDWYGFRFDVAGAMDSYGWVGLTQRPSTLDHVAISDAQVAIELDNIGAPNLSNLDISGTTGRQIHVDSTDVVLAYGYFNDEDQFVQAPVVWDLEAPLDITVTRSVREGQDDPLTQWRGMAGLVDIIVEGEFHCTDPTPMPSADPVKIFPFEFGEPAQAAQLDTLLAESWSGLEVWGGSATLQYLDIGFAHNPVRVASLNPVVLDHSVVHHYAETGIRIEGGGSGYGTTIEDTGVYRGRGLHATKGIWGINAVNPGALTIKDSYIYDYDHAPGSGWNRPRVGGGGIQVIADESKCTALPPSPRTISIRGNHVVGPGADHATGRTGIRQEWLCGLSTRTYEFKKNVVQEWSDAGIDAFESSDVTVKCNRMEHSRNGLWFYGKEIYAGGPDVKFQQNYWLNHDDPSVVADHGVSKLAFVPANAIHLTNTNAKYVLFEDDVDTLVAYGNQWQPGLPGTSTPPENTEQEVRDQSDFVGGADPTQLSVATLLTGQDWYADCVPDNPAAASPPAIIGAGQQQGGAALAVNRASVEVGDPPAGADDASEGALGVVGEDWPQVTGIERIAPIPARGATRIRFGIAGRAAAHDARLCLYDLSGRRVRTLVDGPTPPGWTVVIWDGRGDGGMQVASGVYFARLEAGDVVETRKLVWIR